MAWRLAHRVFLLLPLYALSAGLVAPGVSLVHADEPQTGAAGGNAAGDESTTSHRAASWLAAYTQGLREACHDALQRYLDQNPKLREAILESQNSMPRPLGDFVENNVGKRYIIYMLRTDAFEPTGQVAPSGRRAVVTLKNGKFPIEATRGDRITVVVTLTQKATGAHETSTWQTRAGADRDLRVQLTVKQGGPAFQPGPAVAKASLTHTTVSGVVIFDTTWEREVTLSSKE